MLHHDRRWRVHLAVAGRHLLIFSLSINTACLRLSLCHNIKHEPIDNSEGFQMFATSVLWISNLTSVRDKISFRFKVSKACQRLSKPAECISAAQIWQRGATETGEASDRGIIIWPCWLMEPHRVPRVLSAFLSFSAGDEISTKDPAIASRKLLDPIFWFWVTEGAKALQLAKEEFSQTRAALLAGCRV